MMAMSVLTFCQRWPAIGLLRDRHVASLTGRTQKCMVDVAEVVDGPWTARVSLARAFMRFKRCRLILNALSQSSQKHLLQRLNLQGYAAGGRGAGELKS